METIPGMVLLLLLTASAYGVSVESLESHCYKLALTIPNRCKEQCINETMETTLKETNGTSLTETPYTCDQCIKDNIPQACWNVAPLEVPKGKA